MKERRKQNWLMDFGWFGWVEEDIDRLVSSVEVLPEDLQDFSLPMVVIGSDVEALYPSLDSKRVARMVSEAIMMSKVTWMNLDYMEACWYIALNWSADQCRRSNLESAPYKEMQERIQAWS